MVGKKFRLKPLKQKPLPGGKRRRKIAKRVRKRIKKAFPLATSVL